MKKQLCLLAICLPLLITAQSTSEKKSDGGIKWTTGLSWHQVKQKAKAENKYIFLDCFTTWCGPCKMLDKMVFVNDTVGSFFNQNFISVKVQMDKTDNDDKYAKSWYEDAAAIAKEYVVDAYPTAIFFSPEGIIVHKDGGFRPVQDFISMAKLALSPGKVYNDPYAEYKQLVYEYNQEIRHYDKMPYMITTAEKLGDMDLAKKLFKEHLQYASTLNKTERYTKENIELWSSVDLRFSSKAFQFFYKDGDRIDQVMNEKGYSAKVVDNSIQSEIVDSFYRMQKGETTIIDGSKIPNSDIMFVRLPVRVDGKTNPDYVEADWKQLERMIGKKFNKNYIRRNVLTAKWKWYLKHQNMTAASKAYFTQMDKYPTGKVDNGMVVQTNTFAWDTFLQVNDKKILRQAADAMEKVIQQNYGPEVTFDTYANLLYKLGRVKEAIQWEVKALAAVPPINKVRQESYKAVIEQMKKGQPTYLEEGAIWLGKE